MAPRTIRRPGVAAKPATVPKTPKAAPGEEKRRGRLTLTNATSGEDERTRSVASFRRRNQRLTGHRQVEQKEKIAREVIIPETITIQELANRMSERGRGRDQVPDEARADAQDHGRDRCRHRPARSPRSSATR